MGKKRRQKRKQRRKDNFWIWGCTITGIFVVFLIGLMASRATQSNSSAVSIESPPPNTLISGYNIGEVFYPATLKSLIVNPQSQTNYFDFVIDTGNDNFWYEEQLKPKARNLINYFYLGITLPPVDFWVNLNPVEPNRITSLNLGWTDIGKILLEADFKLKKDSCHFTDPRDNLGKRYWDALNKRLQEEGFSNVQITTSNRLWIIPEEAIVEENEQRFTIVSSKLKVCLESEYLSRQQNSNPPLLINQNKTSQKIQDIASEVMKEVVLPTLEYEINYGKAYAPLRQVYDSLILAEVYKQKYWGNGEFFAHCINRGFVDGLESKKLWSKREIFNAYVHSYKNGEYSFYQTEYAPFQFGAMLQKHYFSGGVDFSEIRNVLTIRKANAAVSTQAQNQANENKASAAVGSNGKLVLVKASNAQDPQDPWRLQEIKLTELPRFGEAPIILARREHLEQPESESGHSRPTTEGPQPSDVNLAASKKTTTKLPHRTVNDYIRENLPQDLLDDPASILNYPLTQGYGVEARFIPIQGLFRHTGQFGHIGLGQVYGKPIIYIEAELANQEKRLVLTHDLYEIAKWEKKRQSLGIEAFEMRQWVRENYNEAELLARQWHEEAPSIDNLFAKYQSDIDRESIKFFEKWAPIYNIVTLPLFRIRDNIVAFVKAEDGSRILDICCGTGGQTFAFGKKGYEVVGIDLSENMLKVAKRKNKYKNVRFEVANAGQIPFEDNYFEVSCISFGLHDMPHYVREKALDEMKRVSKKIVIIDYNIPKNKLLKWLHISLISFYESKYFKDFARQDLERLLQQHNLRVIKEAYGLIGFVKILVCEKINSEQDAVASEGENPKRILEASDSEDVLLGAGKIEDTETVGSTGGIDFTDIIIQKVE